MAQPHKAMAQPDVALADSVGLKLRQALHLTKVPKGKCHCSSKAHTIKPPSSSIGKVGYSKDLVVGD